MSDDYRKTGFVNIYLSHCLDFSSHGAISIYFQFPASLHTG